MYVFVYIYTHICIHAEELLQALVFSLRVYTCVYIYKKMGFF